MTKNCGNCVSSPAVADIRIASRLTMRIVVIKVAIGAPMKPNRKRVLW